MTGRRRGSDDARHALTETFARQLPEIESEQTREVVGDYLEQIRPLADRLKPGVIRTAMRRHIIAVQRRIDEFDAQEGDG